ncbi:ABC transporter ATP-binding protein [Patescibacteria group bacterium]|nr:ABC transporter ATP-binding protein [Patescibacteria group bacterium]
MLIQFENISKNYTSEELITPALCGVSFDVEEGEFVAITGSSGSGKSTLMHIIGFLDKATEGKYLFDGEDTSQFEDNKLAQIRNNKIGFVFQMYNLLPRTSVLDNVLLPTIYNAKDGKSELDHRARQLLERVGLSHRINHHPNQLSGGEQQRVAIVRALINNPRLILADEPTGNLDSKSGQEVIEIIQKLNDDGHTIMMVTHEKEVAECARRVLVLRDGQIISDAKVTKRRLASEGIEK